MRHYVFDLPPERIELLFADAQRIPKEHPLECLAHARLWSDSSEKGNGITRDRVTGELCYSVAIFHEDHSPQVQFALRESSNALLNSALFRTVADLIAPYEKL